MAFNRIKLPIPSATSRSTFSIKEFKGLDKASGEDNFMPSRAVEMKNFIRDKVGVVKKRGGFKDMGSKFTEYNEAPKWTQRWKNKEMDNRISFIGHDVIVENIQPDGFCAKCSLFLKEFAEIKNEIQINSAIGFACGDNYYILCVWDKVNKKAALLRYDGANAFKCVPDILNASIVKTAVIDKSDGTYDESEGISCELLMDSDFLPIPLIIANASPSGGGAQMNTPNLLTPLVQETFTVKESDYDNNIRCARYQLSLKNITMRMIEEKTEEKTNEADNKYYYSESITSNAWMKKGIYWSYNENGYRELNIGSTENTKNGMIAAYRSVKVEVYKLVNSKEEQNHYDWVDVTADCFLPNSISLTGTNFVNTQAGALWIPAANITAAPVEGEPNVRITYFRDNSADFDAICKITESGLITQYGVGGYKDRVFLAGGNRIYYSGMDDPLYFGELNYIEPCSADKSIVAMGGQGKFLYAVDSDGITYAIGGTVNEDDSNTFIADASFVIVDRVQGEKPIENATLLDVFGDEFCYLSEEGLVAIRHDDYYDKRYAQVRSRMVGDQLKGRITCACRWGNFLVIGAGSELYLLDELQQTTLPDFKFSGKQYEVFPFDFSDTLGTVEVLKVWVEEDKKAIDNSTYDPNYCWLWMMVKKGSKTYHVLRYDDTISTDTMETDTMEKISKPIVSQWVTPPIRLSSFYRKKNILRLALDVGEIGSAVKVEYRTDGATSYKPDADNWKTLRDYEGRFRVFDYEDIDYGLWTYQTTVPKLQLIINRRPSRKCYSIQFRFTNETENKLALSNFGFTYETEVI